MLCLCFCSCAAAAAAGCANDRDPAEVGLKFNGLIQDEMLYQRNSPINVWGEAFEGKTVTVTLRNTADRQDETASAVADADGKWMVTFPEKEGSFDAYEITAVCEGASIKVSDVLIGDLWLSSGQSNMNLELQYSYEAAEYAADNPNIRLLTSRTYLPYGERDPYPIEPLEDFLTPVWKSATSAQNIGDVSAIGYSFAETLYAALEEHGKGIPIGLIHTAVGATSLDAWIGRVKTDTNPTYRNALQDFNRYIKPADWNKPADGLTFNQMSAMYNTKIAPLSNFSVAGVVWMQGENNVGEIAVYNKGTPFESTYDPRRMLTEGLPVLVEEFTDTFRADSPLPFICAELMPYYYDYFGTGYSHTALPYTIEGFDLTLRQMRADGVPVAMIPSYDVGLEWQQEGNQFSALHPAHPLKKRELGRRMALAAQQLVYDIDVAGMAPELKSSEIRDGSVYLTFDNVGSGLKTINGAPLDGFTIAGKDLVYLRADAEIISSNCVRVSSPSVAEPYAATYAYTAMHNTATLCNSAGIPAIPFRTDQTPRRDSFLQNGYAYYAKPDLWMTCDSINIWAFTEAAYAGWYPAWQNDAVFDLGSAELSVSDDKTQGAAAYLIRYTPEDGCASFGPNLSYLSVMTKNCDYEQYLPLPLYSFLKLDVKNPDNREKSLRIVLKSADGDTYFLGDDIGYTFTVPSGSDYMTIAANLRYIYDENGSLAESVPNMVGLQFLLGDTQAGTLLIDNIRYSF